MKNTSYGKPSGGNKWHVFLDGRSLCGKYGDFMTRTYSTENHRNEGSLLCTSCQKKLDKLVEKGEAKTYESVSSEARH